MKIVLPDGRKIEATNVDFKTKKEDWSEYTLVGGSVLKFKTIITSVIRTEDYDLMTGDPIYIIQSTNISRVKVPEEMRLKDTKKERIEGIEVV
jgi:hypothetical protein